MNMVMGRGLDRLRRMRQSFEMNLEKISNHHRTRRRTGASSSTTRLLGFLSHDGKTDAFDEVLWIVFALIEMWKEISFEDDINCIALEICETNSDLKMFSPLGEMIGEVASIGAANMLFHLDVLHYFTLQFQRQF